MDNFFNFFSKTLMSETQMAPTNLLTVHKKVSGDEPISVLLCRDLASIFANHSVRDETKVEIGTIVVGIESEKR